MGMQLDKKEALKLSRRVVHSIMDRAILINKGCPEHCRDFRIMTSPEFKETLILRWRTINVENPDSPVQCFRYECFELDGTPKLCSIHYTNAEEANAFFESLESHYKQQFAIDHQLGGNHKKQISNSKKI